MCDWQMASFASFLYDFFFASIQARSGFALANSRFTFEGTTVFWCDISFEGITVFRSKMLLLIGRRRCDFLKLMLSAVCCNKFKTMGDLMSSVFVVSFWTEALKP